MSLTFLSSFEKFSEKFKEVKDAARLAREKSQDKELANTALTIAAPQVSFQWRNAGQESGANLCRYQALPASADAKKSTLSWKYLAF